MLTALTIILAGVVSLASGASVVSELDVTTFHAILADADTDSVILFTKKRGSATMMDGLASRLTDSSTRLYTYDVIRNGGYPAGLHLHDDGTGEGGDCSMILFPAGGREPSVYNFAHDPLSMTQEHKHHDDAHDHGHDHGHDHDHADRPSVVGALRWLKTASSFPATIPSIELTEIWEGREEELFQAVASGASVIRNRMAHLKATVARLEAENAALRVSCASNTHTDL